MELVDSRVNTENKYRDEESVCMMFNRFFHMCETEEQKTLVLDMKQAFLEITPTHMIYKDEYEQLLEDFKHALHYAGKNNNVCNFCSHDCGEGGICKGRENRIKCNPEWRGVVQGGSDNE